MDKYRRVVRLIHNLTAGCSTKAYSRRPTPITAGPESRVKNAVQPDRILGRLDDPSPRLGVPIMSEPEAPESLPLLKRSMEGVLRLRLQALIEDADIDLLLAVSSYVIRRDLYNR